MVSTSQCGSQGYWTCRELHGQRNSDSSRVDVSPVLANSPAAADEFVYFVTCVQELPLSESLLFDFTLQGRRTWYGRYGNGCTGFRTTSYYACANKINV